MGTVRVAGLGKAYKQYATPWSRLAEWTLPGGPHHELKWVLRDVGFTVHRGETVGIIGNNGAGKSTLLKLITGTTQPTAGTIEMTGRVAAILELGMGFHGEFTGRQNAYMAGQLLGLTVEEISGLMPEVEAFAEIGEYMDQPVRVYSSGMMVRLAFSIATARRPDVLIVDEALSVGDAYFQHKSFDRIREFRTQGTTLLIVSHDKAAIQSICDRAMLLDAGRLVMEGAPEAVMDAYNAMLAERQKQTVRQVRLADGKVQTVSGTGEATIADIALLDERGDPVDTVDVGQPVRLRVSAEVHADLPELVVGYMIKDRLGQSVFGTNTHYLKRVLSPVSRGEKITFTFAFPANLGEGTYSVAVALHTSESHVLRNYEWRDLALVFHVVNVRHEKFVGVAWIEPDLEIAR
ncbi:MAG TPA: ABC transporter ATP-binding protein [Usitatibacter sp.]|nr:ABC transporter ATP-binding protein [Usitatibacter sp.]